jgi:hypothetical protein
MYKITDYSYQRAKELGVKIKPSTYKGKKIDVLDWNGQYITSIGSLAYSDYPNYIQSHGKEYADKRRRLYHLRHINTSGKLGSTSYYAARILW